VVLVQPGLETGTTLVRQYVSESSRDLDAAVLAVPVGHVHSGDQTDLVSLELVGLDDLATESVLNFQKFLFHTSQGRNFEASLRVNQIYVSCFRVFLGGMK